MYLEIQQTIRQRFVQVVREAFGLAASEPAIDFPPKVEMGDLSLAACFELAKQLRQSPRQIAEQIAAKLLPIGGVERASVAGAGYLNLHLDRAFIAAALFRPRASAPARKAREAGKILVEHTSINPNKAAHIGHLRNAVLGDTFARLLRFQMRQVEVQNYVDNTGVQVADVVVGFIHLDKKSLEDVRKLADDPAVRFDYYCWDLYAKVSQYYEGDESRLALRAEALKAIEKGHGESARMAELISTVIARLHLRTMLRLGVTYDLLVQESEILRLEFWKSAFELMKQRGAIRYEDSGRNKGCWVMSLGTAGEGSAVASQSYNPSPSNPLEAEPAEDVKIIVRSNGTVTYVGKDIAYHLWKFALLGKDFAYEPFYVWRTGGAFARGQAVDVEFGRYPEGHPVWRTAVGAQGLAPPPSGSEPPRFGQAAIAYSVIDTRQSYLQNVVRAAFDALGYREQAANLHHFAYEVVGLSARCAEEMGLKLSAEDRQRPYVEVSGRKGQGIKADDLIDTLLNKALQEVRTREMTSDRVEQDTYARVIAVAALRYFLLKFSRRAIIAFDFKEALAFEGETGPYLQYTVVRARNIVRKFAEAHPELASQIPEGLDRLVSAERLRHFLHGEGGDAFWELVHLAAQLEMVVEQAVSTAEPAALAKYAFRLAQCFNNFYHRWHILSEADAARQRFLLYVVSLLNQTLTRALGLMGIDVPERM